MFPGMGFVIRGCVVDAHEIMLVSHRRAFSGGEKGKGITTILLVCALPTHLFICTLPQFEEMG